MAAASSIINDACQLPYYHGYITSVSQLMQVMNQYSNKTGHFLVRNSFSQAGKYTITVTHSTGIKQIKIERDETHYFVNINDNSFRSISALISYYLHNPVPNDERINNVLLLYPICVSVLVRNNMGRHSCPLPSGTRPVNDDVEVDNTVVSAEGQKMLVAQTMSIKQNGQQGRPLPPLPNQLLNSRTRTQSARDSQIVRHSSATTSDDKKSNDRHQYSYTRNPQEQQVPALMRRLWAVERGQEVRPSVIGDLCFCGLPIEKSLLPHNWLVHISQEPTTYGQVYYESPFRECQTQLPPYVYLELTPDEQKFLRSLHDRARDIAPDPTTARISRARLLVQADDQCLRSGLRKENHGISVGDDSADSAFSCTDIPDIFSSDNGYESSIRVPTTQSFSSGQSTPTSIVSDVFLANVPELSIGQRETFAPDSRTSPDSSDSPDSVSPKPKTFAPDSRTSPDSPDYPDSVSPNLSHI